jgi:hypothetical protein
MLNRNYLYMMHLCSILRGVNAVESLEGNILTVQQQFTS